MLKIRLRRVGAKKQPAYRVVVAESSAPRDGRFVEIIGHYNPLTNPSTIVIDAEKARKWLRNGAQPTERVARLLSAVGVTGASAAKDQPPSDAEATDQMVVASDPDAAGATVTEDTQP